MSFFVGGAPTTLAGDVTGPSNANTVAQISGSAGVAAVLAAALTFGAAVASPTVSQAAPVGATANGQAMTLAPQAGGATSGIPGSLVANIAAPNGGSTEGSFLVSRAGVPQVRIGNYFNVGFAGIWMLDGGSPTSNEYVLISDGATQTRFNTPAGTLSFRVGDVPQLSITTTQASLVQPLAFTARTTVATAGDIRGPKDFSQKARNSGNTADLNLASVNGSDQMQFGDATATLAQLVAGTVALQSNTINMIDGSAVTAATWALNGAGASSLTFGAGTTATIAQSQSTAAGTVDMTIRAQAAKAGSAGAGGNLNLSAGAPDGAGTQGLVRLQSNGTNYFSIGNSGMLMASTLLAVAAGTTTLTATQYAFPLIVLTGTITGAPAVVVLPNQNGVWLFDCSALAGTGGLQFKSGTTTSATIATPLATTSQIVTVSCRGANTVSIGV